MHPFLQRWLRSLIYVAAWAELGVIVGIAATPVHEIPRAAGVALAVPSGLLLGFACLLPWYTCRVAPARGQSWLHLSRIQLASTVVASGLVILAIRMLASALTTLWPPIESVFNRAVGPITVIVLLTYVLSIALHYAWLEIESSRRAEALARDAQLKALKAQINPHFLFNSLNSISALTALDPARARRMCISLADFLRASLRLGERDVVPFSEEMSLTDMYLDVEQARFGDRLRVVRDLDPECGSCEVPALIVQPLVENAVKHGVAMMADGGEILLHSHRDRDRLEFRVTNPFDPDAPAQDRNGVGLRNVRARIEARYGAAGRMHVDATENNYAVTLTIPTL